MPTGFMKLGSECHNNKVCHHVSGKMLHLPEQRKSQWLLIVHVLNVSDAHGAPTYFSCQVCGQAMLFKYETIFLYIHVAPCNGLQGAVVQYAANQTPKTRVNLFRISAPW